MTICFVTDGTPGQVGGIATFNKNSSRILSEAGHHVIMLYVNYENNETDQVLSDGLITTVLLGKTYHAEYKNWKNYFRPGGFNAPNWIAIGMAVREWMLANHTKYGIDIIEVSDYGGAGIFLFDADLPPVVITGHGSLLQFSPYNFTGTDDNATVVQELESLSYRYADAIITHSPVNKNNLEQRFKETPVELAIMPWINEHAATATATENGPMLTVGGLQPVKGVYEICEALEILRQKNITYPLHWIGGDTWLAPQYGQMSVYLADKYPGTWQHTFNWKKELPQAETQYEIEAASLVIIPSLFETFNYVALEAAACKKPLLITDHTGAVAHFTHGKDAWIIPAGDAKALADAIVYLQEQPALRKELGEQAFRTVQQQFTTTAIAESRLKVYKKIINKRKQKDKGLHPALQFLNRYHTFPRKWCYITRSILKKLSGGK